MRTWIAFFLLGPGWISAGPPSDTTTIARKLLLDRIESIAHDGSCHRQFGDRKVDLARLRRTLQRTRFFSAAGPEGKLKFSAVVGRPASPDQTLQALATRTTADAFVLGYSDGERYVRTSTVVLNRGYFQQPEPSTGTLRLTTLEEKQNLLLHELLHIALDVDDDDLNARDLCPLRLLAFCPRGAREAQPSAS
jgi:hypothetical protein